MIERLRKRFIRIAMLAISAVLILLCVIVNVANYIAVDSELTQVLEMIYDNQGSIPHPQPGDPPGRGFTKETPYSTRYFVLRYNDAGDLIRADLEHIVSVTEEDTTQYLQIALKHGEGFGYTSGYKYYVVYSGEDRWMAIFLDSYQKIHSMETIAVLSLVATAFCVIVVYVIVVLFSRRAILPVVEALRLQKQFITDASHELKTPITVISTSLKVLEMESGKQRWLDKAQAQTEKLKDLVNSLVTLSRMDEEDSPMKFSIFNISDCVLEVTQSFEDFASTNGHDLQISVEPDIQYNGDEYAIRQLISILLDNAVKYAVPNTPIVFSLRKSKKNVVISATNQCENIKTEDLDKLFDRFYRADPSRNLGAKGFGIGLSIARSIVNGHNGTICAKSSDDGHTIEFTAELK